MDGSLNIEPVTGQTHGEVSRKEKVQTKYKKNERTISPRLVKNIPTKNRFVVFQNKSEIQIEAILFGGNISETSSSKIVCGEVGEKKNCKRTNNCQAEDRKRNKKVQIKFKKNERKISPRLVKNIPTKNRFEVLPDESEIQIEAKTKM